MSNEIKNIEDKRALVAFKPSHGVTEYQVILDKGADTIWATELQIAGIFGRDRTVINRHIKNAFKERELDEAATSAKIAQVRMEGGREIERKVLHYNLDVIISVGYRVKSPLATEFRIWATSKLKEYLLQGYSINQKRLQQMNQEIQVLRSGIRILGRAIEEKTQDQDLEWLNQFTKGLALLDDYDHERLDSKGLTTTKTTYPTKAEYQYLIDQMKEEFDSDVFGLEKDQSFDSAISQISKGFGEQDFYPSIEEKAATLLYLITKNHAFTDGNKRIAAACFLMFLEKNAMLIDSKGIPLISNEALASTTLFVAASKPEEMETVKKLIVSILNRNKK